MIEKISLCLRDESGASIEIAESQLSLQSKTDILIADTFSKICFMQNDIEDEETRTAEKFRFAVVLNIYLKEFKEYVRN